MQRQAWKTFWACAIGAGIGGLIALEMHASLSWIGVILGGIAGYLSYEWRTVVRAIPAAYRAVREWRAPGPYWKEAGWNTLALLTLGFDALIAIAAPTALFSGTGFHGIYYESMGVASIILPMIIVLNIEDLLQFHQREYDINIGQDIFRFIVPHRLFFWYLPRGLLWVFKRLPRFALAAWRALVRAGRASVRFTRVFLWQMFLRIHSEMRLLCGVDAMLGACIGYFSGSVLLGALSGGVIGVLNYVVVTELWLKKLGIIPIRSS